MFLCRITSILFYFCNLIIIIIIATRRRWITGGRETAVSMLCTRVYTYSSYMNIVRSYHYVVYTSRRLYRRCILLLVTGYIRKHETARHSPRLVAIVSRPFFYLRFAHGFELAKHVQRPNFTIFQDLFLCIIRNMSDAYVTPV